MEETLKTDAESAKDLKGVSLVSTDKELREFINFPYSHYSVDPAWVPPLKIQQKGLLDKKNNPFYKNAEIALFLAYENGEIAGRIAAIHNHSYNRTNDVNAGFFGFFECVNNQFVADLLFRVVIDWLRDRGCTKLLGPMSPGLLDEIGILVDGFEHKPAILMPYSKPWYDTLIQSTGLKKEMDLFAYKVTEETIALERMDRSFDIVMKRTPGLTIRPVNFRNFNQEVDILHHIFNKAWAKNWGFYEIDREVVIHLAKEMKQIIDIDFAHIAEIDGNAVGFSIALPDYNQVFSHMDGTLFPVGFLKLLWYRRKIKAVRTALLGVLPEYQGRGIDALLTRESIIKGMKRGFNAAEVGWLLETNTSILRVVERVGAYKEKTYRLYGRQI